MTAPAPPPDTPRPRRVLAGLSLAAALVAAVAVAVAVTAGGCSKPPAPPPDLGNTGPKGDPWKVAGVRLKKDADLGAAKSALLALTTDVNNQDGPKLPALSDEAFAALAAVVPLSPADREEIRAGAFSAHDPVYLADCLYLRDAARSLAAAGLPPEKRAELAFAWVCRQVYLRPWPRPVGAAFEPTALPPTAVLRRGYGSGLERMYVFLALLQQLELDACLIGGPDAGGVQSRMGPALAYPLLTQVLGFQRGPFWAAGVRVGSDVRLFDPWRGQPFPVTLAQLKADPGAAKAWFEDKANLSGATPADAKQATAFLAVPVNALSPRMAVFEAQLKGELGVKVAFDAPALAAKRAAFPDPKPAYWNPPDDPFAYGRVARSYLPLDLGGSDPTAGSGGRLYEASLREQVPETAITPPDELKSESAKGRFRNTAANTLVVSFLEPPNPRERIQRGQFQDAARDVVAKQEAFAAGLERLRSKDTDQQIKEWIETANLLYAALGSARLNNDKAGEAAAAAQVETHWKQPGKQLLVDKASAEVGRAEASFLLGLCKHEQAERLQARLERAPAAEVARLKTDALDAWKTALSAWRTYEQLSAAHAGFPGRAAHAGALAARAATFVEAAAKK